MSEERSERGLVWMDVETTGLEDHHWPWDVALIERRVEGTEQGGREFVDITYQWFVHPADIDLPNADAKALEIGKFWTRHPDGPQLVEWGARDLLEDGTVSARAKLSTLDMFQLGSRPTLRPTRRRLKYIARDVHSITCRRAMILGSKPSFDQGVMGRVMLTHGITPQWHHHPIDVPTMISGWLLARGASRHAVIGMKSDHLCLAIGLNPSNYERHSAQGDCELFRDAFDKIARIF